MPLRDDSLPHQMRIIVHKGKICVSCNCLRYHTRWGKGRLHPLAPAPTTDIALSIYGEHLEEVGYAGSE